MSSGKKALFKVQAAKALYLPQDGIMAEISPFSAHATIHRYSNHVVILAGSCRLEA